jgi:RNA polymerase sigma-54 factor
MSMLSPRLQLKVSQKQILTPGLVQMVTVLQLSRLELKDMITQEIAENPVLEESADGIEELTPEEMQSILEAERVSDPSDHVILETVNGTGSEPEIAAGIPEASPPETDFDLAGAATLEPAAAAPAQEAEVTDQKTEKDPFDEIDFGTFFDDYLDPGYKSRDVSFLARHVGRSFAFPISGAGDVGGGAGRGGQHYWQPGRKRLSHGHFGRDRRVRTAHPG